MKPAVPSVMEFGASRVISPDGSHDISTWYWPEFAMLTLMEPEPALAEVWVRRIEAALGVTDAHRRYLTRQDLQDLDAPAPKRGHALVHELKDDGGAKTGRWEGNVREIDPHLEWYLVRAATRREFRAEEALIEAQFAVYVPRMKRWRRTGRDKVRVDGAAFGGYMFVGLFPDQSMKEVEAIDAVHAVVRFSANTEPHALAFDQIRTVIDKELAGEFDKTRRDRRKDPEPGTAVEITGGQFKGFPAEFVTRREDERIEVLFQMFGRSSKLVLKPEEVGGLGDGDD